MSLFDREWISIGLLNNTIHIMKRSAAAPTYIDGPQSE